MHNEIQVPSLMKAYNSYIQDIESQEIAKETKPVTFYIKEGEMKCLPINEKMTDKGFKKISTARVAHALYTRVIDQHNLIEKENIKAFIDREFRENSTIKKKSPLSFKTILSKIQNLFTIHRFKTSEELVNRVYEKLLAQRPR